MKWIMVVIICFTADVCERMYDQEMYNTMDECIAASDGVAEYMKESYPATAGKIFCLDEENFENYKKQLEINPNYTPDFNQSSV
jgi:hypothetical protein